MRHADVRSQSIRNKQTSVCNCEACKRAHTSVSFACARLRCLRGGIVLPRVGVALNVSAQPSQRWDLGVGRDHKGPGALIQPVAGRSIRQTVSGDCELEQQGPLCR
eukprot:4033002-Pleurochrysis_carterae.AAC.1